jgi:hypothetical protein
MDTTNILYTNLSQIPGFNDLINNDNPNISNILKLNKIEYKTEGCINKKYKIIRYDKNMLSIDLIPTYGLCRSIILTEDNKIISFSPPKSLPSDIFIKKYPEYPFGNEIKSEESLNTAPKWSCKIFRQHVISPYQRTV